MMSDGLFDAADLRPVVNSTTIEYIGGPNDGELRPVHENGARHSGTYIIESVKLESASGLKSWVPVAKRWVPT
jgi:hypothetical protein